MQHRIPPILSLQILRRSNNLTNRAPRISGEKDRYRIMGTFFLCSIVSVAPLPLGSTNNTIVAAWVLIMTLSLLFLATQHFTNRDCLFLVGFAAVALTWLAVVAAQLGISTNLTLPFDPPIWLEASKAIDIDIPSALSIARNQPYYSAGPQLACMLAVACGYLAGKNRQGAWFLIYSFAVSGLGYALYSITAFIFWPNTTLWLPKTNYPNSLTATFTNPNVAAVYFGSVTIFWSLLLTGALKRKLTNQKHDWRTITHVIFTSSSRREKAFFGAALLSLTSTAMTASRAGFVFSIVTISGGIAWMIRNYLSKRSIIVGFPLACVTIVFVLLQILGGRANQRFGLEGLFDSGRWNTYLATVRIIADYPWFGTGLGTFRWIFPAYRTGEGEIPAYGLWEQAHNTTLEIASELGVPFATLVVLTWVAMLAILANGAVRRRRDAILPLSAFWICALAAMHAQIDFSLQIPGYALSVYAIAGMGMAQSFSSSEASG